MQKSKENHYLDCEALQAAGAHLLNAARISDKVRTAPTLQPAGPDEETVEGEMPAPPADGWLRGGPRPVRHSMLPDPSRDSWVMAGRNWGGRWGNR
jgi:hypothetical protein